MHREILPRQLALETIHSLENILLPLHDTGRHALVERMNLDSGCVQLVELEETQYRRDVEFHIKYHYWGARLKKLEGEVERPGRIRACFRAASSNRFLMLITAIGVLFAAGELIKEFMRK